MPLPCEGLRVLDVTEGMPGNLACAILADYGADVLKVERPGGDRWRGAVAWPFWNRGKRTAEVDLKSPEGLARACALAAGADVVVESWRPGTTERLGLGYESVRAANPAVVYCSVSGFGPRGSYVGLKGYEGIVDAKSGRMFEFTGIAPRPGPGFAAVATASTGAMHGAVQGILAALHRRRQTGAGAHVQASLLQGHLSYDIGKFASAQFAPVNVATAARTATNPNLPRPNYMTAVTKDGHWLQFANTVTRLYREQIRVMGLSHLFDDPRFANLPFLNDPDDSEPVWEAVLERAREKTWAEWKEIFDHETDVAVEPFLTTLEAFDHPQVRHNRHIVEAGGVEQPGPILAIDGVEPCPPRDARPVETGEAGWLAERAPAPTPMPAADPAGPPLAGVTVLDFANYVATPFGSQFLADMGARVIKVEPVEGEYSRAVSGGLLIFKTGQGKECIAIDLKDAEGQAVIRRLIAKADIVVHNFRPGAMERLGLGPAEVRALNPRAVYHYGASYGPTGPYAARPAMHPTMGAVSGTAKAQLPPSAEGENDATLPMSELKQLAWRYLKANEGNPDVSAALGVGTGLMLGLQARETSGVGHYQFTTMLNSGLYARADEAVRFPGRPPLNDPDPMLLGTGPLYRLYACASGWVFLACPFEHEWQALAHALGHAEWLADARFATAAARAANAAELTGLLETCFATRSAEEWERDLTAVDVACARADERGVVEFAFKERSNFANGYACEVEHPRWGKYYRYGLLATVEGAAAAIGAVCELGGESRAIMRELGYADAEVDAMRTRGVVACFGE